MFLLALLVGVGAGLGAVAFRYLVYFFTWLATGHDEFGQDGYVGSSHLPWLGLGFASALVALVVLACPPVLVNTDVAFRGVDASAVEAARAMGMTSGQVLWRVETPLALPVVLSGLRVAAVEVVASATLATLIGAGGLGDIIVGGLELNEPGELLVGSLAAAALALIAAAAFAGCERLAAARR